MIVRALKWGTVLIVLVVGWLVAYSTYMYRQIRDCAVRDEAQRADTIVVLGAAQYNGRPSPVFKARLDHGLDLFNKGYAQSIIDRWFRPRSEFFGSSRRNPILYPARRRFFSDRNGAGKRNNRREHQGHLRTDAIKGLEIGGRG